MDRSVRKMTFEEEAKFYEEEARAEFAKETGNGDSGGVNNILRRGMRVISKARQEIASREVVRCGDCKWYNHIGYAIYIVDDTDKPKEDDFCSFGERKQADNEK